MKRYLVCMAILGLAYAGHSYAQGQDSSPDERDLQVIAELLKGGFDNANQAYFDRRTGQDTQHRRLHVEIEADAPEDRDNLGFTLRGYWDNDAATALGDAWRIQLARGNAFAGVAMQVSGDGARCDYIWQREAAQFRAVAVAECPSSLPQEWLLAGQQLWLDLGENRDFRLHRIRRFSCYADLPGVGGGRDIPYTRYDDLAMHDQGGQVWFTTEEGRELGISLLLVDWPINNYEGVFTRDSFVIYVSERSGDERQELGYAFTIPEADRIGINLKWMLASCYMRSNALETPSM